MDSRLALTRIVLLAVTAAAVPAQEDATSAVPQRPDLIPPESDHTTPVDELAAPIFIDVTQDGRVEFDGETWYSAEKDGQDRSGMLALLLWIKKGVAEDAKRELKIGSHRVRVVDVPVVFRVDRSAEWVHVLELVNHCSKPEAAFWNLHLAAAAPAGDDEQARLGVFAIPLPTDPPQPRNAEPVEHLELRVVCTTAGEPAPRGTGEGEDAERELADLEGHEIIWTLGPRRFVSAAALEGKLAELLADRARWPEDPATGEKVPMPVVIQARGGAIYGDVVRTLDLLATAREAAALDEPLAIRVGY